MLKDLTQEDKFIQEGLKEIDEEVKSEDEIKEQAEYITSLLNQNPVVRVEYAGSTYTLSAKQTKKPEKIETHPGNKSLGIPPTYKTIQTDVIVLVAINENRRREAYLANRAYIAPATYTGYYNDEFTYQENLIAVVEAFLRHVIGELKIEEEDDGIAKIAREKDFLK